MYFNFILVFSHIKNQDDESNKLKWFRLNCFDVIVAFLHRGATYGKLKNDLQKSVFICKRSLQRALSLSDKLTSASKEVESGCS